MWFSVVLTRGAEGRSVVYYVAIEAVHQFWLKPPRASRAQRVAGKADAPLLRHLLRLLRIFRSLQLTRHLAQYCPLNLQRLFTITGLSQGPVSQVQAQ